MPTAIFDSSYLTARKRAGVLNAYSTANNDYRTNGTNGDYNIVRRNQPTEPLAEVLIAIKQGGCFCRDANAQISIQANAPGACSCAR
jgi:hypothetical protein